MGHKKKEKIAEKIPMVHDANFLPSLIKSEKEFDVLYNLSKIEIIFNPLINHCWYGIREMLPQEIEYLKKYKKDWIFEQLLKEI
jgi:hypothetical protein